MPLPPDRPAVVPRFTPDDITLGEVYRVSLQASEDIAYVRGAVEHIHGEADRLEVRVASLEGFRAGVRRSVLTIAVAFVPISATAYVLAG